MPLFEFILLIVLITTLGKIVIEVGGPLIEKIGDLVTELAASKRADRQGVTSGDLDPEVLEELERRLARIEDRLDFLEELKAPDRRRTIGGRGPDRGGSPAVGSGGGGRG